jgi:FKBP-type peptidyl-prolyl cis-trans isomerase SlpA
MSDETPLRAGPDMRITLHFSIRFMDGTPVDSTAGKPPASFVWGDGSLLPGFERALSGLKAGDKRSVFIDAKSGFGERNEDNIQHFPRHTFADDMELAPGVVVSFADAARAELPGVIQSVDNEWVTVDFNHPLAGRDLTFEVEIVSVERHVPEQAVQLQGGRSTPEA